MISYDLLSYFFDRGKENIGMKIFAPILAILLPILVFSCVVYAYRQGKEDLAKEVLEGHPSVVAEYKVSTEIEYKRATDK